MCFKTQVYYQPVHFQISISGHLFGRIDVAHDIYVNWGFWVKNFFNGRFLIPQGLQRRFCGKIFLTAVFNFPGATEGICWLKKIIYNYICPGSLRIVFLYLP